MIGLAESRITEKVEQAVETDHHVLDANIEFTLETLIDGMTSDCLQDARWLTDPAFREGALAAMSSLRTAAKELDQRGVSLAFLYTLKAQ